jgi:Kef-type K+ transport system membrane component KefB
MTEHQLFLFLAEVAVLVVAARLGGELALRVGVPQVVGELVLGICLGPSLLGLLWKGGFAALFPADPTQRNLLEIIGWMGVIFLVVISGLETRLETLRNSGRAVATGWLGGFSLPFALGFALGWLVPQKLIGAGISRPLFALFMATAMSISAIPVIARILLDLDLLKTRIGMVILSTATADDTVGWIILAVVTGLASVAHRVDFPTVLTALLGTAAFLVLAATVGQRLVDGVLGASARLRLPYAQLTAVLVLVFLGAAATQAIHVHLVLGCFVTAILVARSRHLEQSSIQAVRTIGMAFFVPFFFSYTGVKVDLTTVTGSAVPVAAAAVVVAYLGKLVGGGVGARLGGLPRWEAAAVGAGLNARGAMELVIAAVGVSIGVLTPAMFAIVVLIAATTTLTAAPMLKYCVRRQQEVNALQAASVPAELVDRVASSPDPG